MGEAAVVLTSPPRDIPALTPAEEADLRWYFGLDLPAAPGTGSSFGAMCDRLQRAHAKTTERPSDDVSWTEIVFCGRGHGSVVGDAIEDAMHAHIDGRRRATKLRAVLERLSALDCAVLEARYHGGAHNETLVRMFAELAGVVLVTEAIHVENVRRAANDQHETADRTVAGMLTASKDRAASKDDRVAARRWIERARSEAHDLVAHAIAAFVQAKRIGLLRR